MRGIRAESAFRIGTSMRKLLQVEQWDGLAWQPLTLTLAGHTAVQKTNDLAVWRWRYELPDGTDVLGARLTVTPGTSKWDYGFRAAVTGRYRLRVVVQMRGATGFEQFITKGAAVPYMVYWRTPDGTLAYNWRDMLAQVAGAQANVRGLRLTSKAAELLAGETVTLDPSVGPLTASWGADVDGSTKFPNDGSDYCGGDGTGGALRVANKWDISSLSASDTVTQVDSSINVSSVTSAGSLLWDIRGYGTNGQGNPETDSGATMFAACAPGAGNIYVNDTTQFRTTGLKTFTALGAQANTDVEAARDAGSIFSIACAETTSITTANRCEFSEYTNATNPPKLTITYSTAGAVLYTQLERGIRGMNRGMNAGGYR